MKVNKVGLIESIIGNIKTIKYQLDDDVKPYAMLTLTLDWCKDLREILKIGGEENMLMQIVTEVKPENEHPYRIKIDGSYGIGITPSSAIMAALSVSKKIPSGTRDRKKAVDYILTNYPPKKGWVKIMRMLTCDNFTVFMD